MKVPNTIGLAVTLTLAIISGCANEKPLSGGPKDETPPSLVSSDPENETINFTGDKITMTFSEPVKVEQLATQLIVTPTLESPPEYTIRKNTVIFTFKEPLADSTTYVFNFREAIKDITESNIAPNLTLSLSTGTFIDSMYVNGRVYNAYDNKALEKVVVGLYPLNDTVDLFTGQPYYFTQADGSGHFSIKNIRAGQYRIWAWMDDNGNLKADARNEPYAFHPDTLNLNGDSIPPILLLTQQIDPQELKINSARANGRYYEINFNKSIVDYNIQPLEENQASWYSYAKEGNKLLRFYNRRIQDSTGIYITATDTLGQTMEDTVYLRFEPSVRKPQPFTLYTTPKNGSAVSRETEVTFNFSKPVAIFRRENLQWVYDSLNITPTTVGPMVKWNENRTQVRVTVTLPDSITTRKIIPIDSVTADTNYLRESLTRSVNLFLPFNSIISVERDTLPEQLIAYTPRDSTQLAILRGKIISTHPGHIVQLLSSGKLVMETYVKDAYVFRNVKPGDYSIRVLADQNGDGQWSPGNIVTQTPAEPIKHFQGPVQLRANWERNDVDVDFTTKLEYAPIPPQVQSTTTAEASVPANEE